SPMTAPASLFSLRDVTRRRGNTCRALCVATLWLLTPVQAPAFVLPRPHRPVRPAPHAPQPSLPAAPGGHDAPQRPVPSPPAGPPPSGPADIGRPPFEAANSPDTHPAAAAPAPDWFFVWLLPIFLGVASNALTVLIFWLVARWWVGRELRRRYQAALRDWLLKWLKNAAEKKKQFQGKPLDEGLVKQLANDCSEKIFREKVKPEKDSEATSL